MGVNDILSALGALAIIALMLVFTYYGSRWYARRMGGAGTGKHIRVIDRAVVGGGSFLVIAQIGEHFYLLGVSEKRMELICELADFDPLDQAGPQSKALTFGQIFSDLMEKARGNKNKGDDRGET